MASVDQPVDAAMKIAIAGMGYVGLGNAIALAHHHEVVLLDIDAERVEFLRTGRSPIVDKDVEEHLAAGNLRLSATLDPHEAHRGADVVIVATPTNYDPDTNEFDTSSVESVIADVVAIQPDATIVVKSTIPVGFTEGIRRTYPDAAIMFSPEFLREGLALHDTLHPSRIVVGDTSPRGKEFANLLAEAAEDDDVTVMLTGSTEAEAIKLFANTYLALRVAYFNELDTYASTHGLDTREIIEGVSLDPRIGDHYNNPSFGYGGYCLPKDTRQLLANYSDVPQNLIKAVVAANATRKDFVAADILALEPRVVGIHRLIMKAESDNFRSSSIQGIMRRLALADVTVIVHEPELDATHFHGWEVVDDLDEFIARSDLVVTNRWSSDLVDAGAGDKIYTRDLFGRD